jgi:hypothetical protein
MIKLLQAIDKIGAAYGQALIPIRDSLAMDASRILGTAFFANFEGHCYLVSALHVLAKEGKKSYAYLDLNGRPFALGDKDFFYCAANDVGFFRVEGDFKQATAGIPRIRVEREQDELADSAQGVVVIGFPYLFRPDEMITAVPVSTWLETRGVDTTTKIARAKLYWFNDDMLISTDEMTRIYNLDAHGMSGGPAVAWFNRGSEAMPNLEAKLQAVLVQWHTSDGYLVGAKTATLVELIDSTLKGKALFL